MTEWAIDCRGLTKYFSDFCAVDNAEFQVQPGEIFGLLGPNGAGKTTLIRLLVTLLSPTSGTAEVFGNDIITGPNGVRSSLGLVSEKLIMYNHFSPLQNLEFYARLCRVPRDLIEQRAEEFLNLVELWQWRNKKIGTFSHGMKQRINIIRALMHDPKILFLDEPTLGLDPQTSVKIRKFLVQLKKDYNKTILITTHYMQEAHELSDRIGIIDHGKIVALDTPIKLMENADNAESLEEAFIRYTGEDMRDMPDEELYKKAKRRSRGPH